ncbi:hypothetical protein Tco_0137981 [Tanacetum coccineum]
MVYCQGQKTTTHGKAQLHALVDGKKIIITEASVRRDLQLADEDGVDCLLNSTIFEQLTLMGSKTTAWNEFSSTMASAIIRLATNQKSNFSKYIFESMIRNLDNLSGKFLMYPRKPKRKDTQIPQPSDPSKNVADEAVHKELGDSLVRAATTASTLEAEQDSGNITKTRSKATPNESSSLGTTSGGGPRAQNENVVEEVVDAAQVSTAAKLFTITTEENYFVQAEKGKGIMIEEPMKPMKKKYQINFDEETALKLQAECNKEERLTREKAKKEKEANIYLIEEWDDIQAKIDVDHQLAKRLQAQEQEELSDAKKVTLFQQLLEKRRKHFVATRAEEKRNKPPTKDQQKKIMCTYLKNMEGYKLNDLKLKDFDSIQVFDRALSKKGKYIEVFRNRIDGRHKGKKEIERNRLIQEITKKQKKVEDD